MYQSAIHNYYVYILTNKNKTVLYTGVTNNLRTRLYQHQHPNIHSKSFTARYNCFYLIYYNRFDYINDAIAYEKQIKGWTRSKKIALINSQNPQWEFMNDLIFDE
ncbi:MAG: GIY-YIG nuclease family protein [Bacteroidetes bacterium]|nr:GIY-YIG nuclease family protein [Bacteroidota bacterium]